MQKRQKEDKKRKQALENEHIFHELKSKFFGLQFSDDLIQIKILESVEQVMQEGDVLHHCVFTNNYHFTVKIYLNPLILWNKIDLFGKRVFQKLLLPDGIIYNRELDQYRTTRTNSFFSLIGDISRGLDGNKKGDFLKKEKTPN